LAAFAEIAIPILFMAQPANEKRAIAVDQLLWKLHVLHCSQDVYWSQTITAGSQLATSDMQDWHADRLSDRLGQGGYHQ
jgi:hypothetical protein